MFLKSLEINGFKSFADKTHIEFSDGITSLLGPNGCGKSNIVDSIKWVLGEQSTKTLRAGNMQDVIFAGTETRKPLPMAEVTLTIDNEEHHLPTELPEISIRRRIYRTGESEYYLNGQRCLLKNIRELFMDTGVGKVAYSILEQGKIDQILSSRPEDRRYIFEEAAGISRFKSQCNEAKNRIERSQENIDKLLPTLNEIKRTYDRTKNQALKAKEYDELVERAFETDVDMRIVRVKSLTMIKAKRESDKAEAERVLAELQERLATFNGDIVSSNGEVDSIREKVKALEITIGSMLTESEGIKREISILEENYKEYCIELSSVEERCKSISSEIASYRRDEEESEQRLSEYEDSLNDKNDQLSYIERKLSEFRTSIASLSSEEHDLSSENDTLDSTLIELTERLKGIVEALINEVEKKTGSAYSLERRRESESELISSLERIRAYLLRTSDLISSLDPDRDVEREFILHSLDELAKENERSFTLFGLYKASIPPILDLLLDPEGLMAKKREVESEEKRCRERIEENRARISQIKADILSKQNDTQSYQNSYSAIKEHIGSYKSLIDSQRDKINSIKLNLSKKEFELEDERDKTESNRRRLTSIQEKLQLRDDRLKLNNKNIEAKKAELNRYNTLLNESFRALNEKRNEREETLRLISSNEQSITNNELLIKQGSEMIGEIFTSFYEKYARNLGEFSYRMEEPNLPDEITLKAKLDDINKQIHSLGNINHLAKEEFESAEDQYQFLSRQLADYEKAKSDMEKVLFEIQNKSEELFMKSYNEISDNFKNMFRRLFGGGRAELRLTDESDVLSSGIDILAQPPGKNMATLSLLSGGERSMTAVALLFATYQVKPSPFCILDEIDAALDDKNIGYFLDVLQDFGAKSQFIIITHNVHTVTGGNSMLGVSQMEAGVSNAVSYRIGNVKGKPVIMNDNEEEVEFDSTGKRK